MGGIPGTLRKKRGTGQKMKKKRSERQRERERERERRVDSDSSSVGHKPFFFRSPRSRPLSFPLYPRIKGSVDINKKALMMISHGSCEQLHSTRSYEATAKQLSASLLSARLVGQLPDCFTCCSTGSHHRERGREKNYN